MLASFALAQGAATNAPASLNLPERYPAGSIQSVEIADRALEDVKRARSAIEAQYVVDEHGCYPKFFTTSCLQDAKERRRRALAQIKPIEVDANSFKRHARVIERDAALSEKQQRKEVEAPQRENQSPEAHAAAKTVEEQASDAKAIDDKERKNRANAAKRVADHQAKLKRQAAQEAANAQKRADNIKAYEQKVRDSEARQREIEAKKLEK